MGGSVSYEGCVFTATQLLSVQFPCEIPSLLLSIKPLRCSREVGEACLGAEKECAAHFFLRRGHGFVFSWLYCLRGQV